MKSKAVTTIIFSVCAIFFAGVACVHPLPEVDEVVSGEAEIKITDSQTMNIDAANHTIINYTSFNINENEKVYINLPSRDSDILNRVTGKTPSYILGDLYCNGVCILVNASGIYVGQNANIDAAGLVLSTRDITDSDFISGNYVFKKLSDEQLDMLLLNEGTIKIHDGGFGVLIAGAVENRGTIICPAGKIVLAGGDAIKLDIAGNGLISVAILEETASKILDYEGNPITDQIKNSGRLEANGGTVILKAESVTDIFQCAINLEGFVMANKVEEKDGKICLVADSEVKLNAEMQATQIEISAGKISGAPDRVHAKGDYLKVEAPEINIHSEAITTHIIDTDSGINIKELIEIPESNLIKLIGEDTGEVTYIKTHNITLETPRGDVNTAPGVVIPGNEVKVSARRIGSRDNPVNIDANLTYINRIQGDIIVSDMWGLGSTISIRGPDPHPDSWGAVVYNGGSDLVLEAENVVLSGNEPVHLYGNITFHNLSCTVPGKEIYFEAGKTCTILGDLKMQGADAQHIKLLSSEEGSYWFIDARGGRDLTYTWVEDSYNLAPDEVMMTESTNRGGCFGWDPTATWTGAVDNLWSEPGNWIGLGGGVIPGAGDDVVFDVTSSADSTIDQAFTIASLTIDAAYGGTITQSGNLAVSGDYAQSGGTLSCTDPAAHSFTVGGSFNLTGGAFNRFTGTGTSGDPFLVRDIYDLQAIDLRLYSYYSLNNNVDAAVTQSWNSDGAGGYYGFNPIGSSSTWFSAVFDGRNNTISNLYINRPAETHIGLFARTRGGGQGIRNVGLVGGSVTGGDRTGSLVGYVEYSVIENCYATTDVTGTYRMVGGLVGSASGNGRITGSYAEGTVAGAGSNVGGLVGQAGNNFTIENSYATGAVTNSSYNTGGLVGNVNNCTITGSYATGDVSSTGSGEATGGLVGYFISGTITDCYATGNIISNANLSGGLVGYSQGTISGCYATGEVTGAMNGGGLVGGVYPGGIVENSYAMGDIISTSVNVGGLIGYSWSATVSNCYSAGVPSGTFNVGGLIGSDSGGTYTANYWDTQTSGTTDGVGSVDPDPAGVTGKTTAEMKQQATFSGWDFSNTWIIDEGSSYPLLQWQLYIWDAGGDGTSWTDPLNWNRDSGYPDDADDRVLINTGSATIVTPFGASLTIGYLNLGSGFAGTLQIANALTLDNTGQWQGGMGIAAGTLQQNADIAISGDYAQSGGTFTCTTGDVTIGGTFTQSAGEFNAPAGNLYVKGDFSRTGGTFNHNSGTIIFDGTTGISGSSTNSFNNVTITGALTAPNANMNVAGDWTNSGTFNAGTGTVTFNGTASGKEITNGTGNSFNNVQFTGAGGEWTLQDDMGVTGQFKVTDGVFISGTNAVTLQGASATYLAADVNSANTDWTGGTLIILSDMDQTLPSSETYNNLQLGRDAGTGTTVYDILDTGSTINGTWTIDADARVLLAANATGVNKVYDDTTDAAVTLSDNRMAGWYDNFTTSYFSADFSDQNVGVGKAVSVNGISLSGSDAGKYQLSSTTASTTADITAKPLTITAQPNTKVYDDGVTAAAVPLVSGLEGNDTVTGLSEVYDTQHAGTGKTLSVDTYTVNDGNSGNNYSVSLVSDTTGEVTTRPITVTALTDTKVCDGTTSSAEVPVITVGSLAGDDTADWTQTFDTMKAGTDKVLTPSGTVNDGNGGLNYAVTFITDDTGVILPAAVSYLLFIDQPPAHEAAGAVITPAITVNAYDGYDNLCTNDSSTVIDMAIDNNPGGGILSGDTDKVLVNGVATFNDLSIDQKGVGYTLVTSSGAAQQDTSNSFNIGIAVWDGSESTAWNTPGNWDIGDTPPASYDVQIPVTPNDPVLSGPTTVDNLTINSGAQLSAGSNTLTVNGNWTNNGTFDAGASTVIFSGGGDAVISGSNTFNNLRSPAGAKQSLTFENGETQIIEGTLFLRGIGESDLLILQSGTPGQEWFIENPSDNNDMEFLDVRDSHNLGSLLIAPGSTLTDCIGWATAPPSPPAPQPGIAANEDEINNAVYASDRIFGDVRNSIQREEVARAVQITGRELTVMSWEAVDMINIPPGDIGTGIERAFAIGEEVFRVVP
ncbi:MAG: GLUG motif-containing protein [Candidatus Omnitrophota bacterium]